MSEIESYQKNGYYIKRKLLSKDICRDIISQLNEIKTDMKIPHTNIQFGYGNIINTDIASIITNNIFIKDFCDHIYGPEYYYNSLYVHNKHKWVGPDVEWHQEVFNMKTFHPTNNKYTLDEIKNNFFIRMDNSSEKYWFNKRVYEKNYRIFFITQKQYSSV